MTPEDYAKLMEFEIEKQIESRKIRSTKVFYDKSYWGEFWVKRFNSQLREDDSIAKVETQKKVDFINRYTKGCKSILDAGCGHGFLTAAMHDLGWNSWGVDISNDVMEYVPERVRDKVVPVSLLRMTELFSENQFDLVTCFDVLEHLYIEEIMEAVMEINRVASKEIIIRVPVPGHNAEPYMMDFSYKGGSRDHVSIYPVHFWVRRIEFHNKFKFWMSQKFATQSSVDTGYNDGEIYEAWICFRRRSV